MGRYKLQTLKKGLFKAAMIEAPEGDYLYDPDRKVEALVEALKSIKRLAFTGTVFNGDDVVAIIDKALADLTDDQGG